MNNLGAYPLPKAPPNDPERAGNIWQQYEQLQANYKALQDQLTAERTQYIQEKRTTENAVGVLLEENHTLHRQVASGSSGAQAGQDETGSAADSDQSGLRSHVRSSQGLSHMNSFRTEHNHPRAVLQQMFPGKVLNGYDLSPDGTSSADIYDQQYQQYYPNQQGVQYGSTGNAIDQLEQLRAELASKDEHIVHLQHNIQSLKGQNSHLQHTVDDTDSHRRQVQSHNSELEMQLDSLLNEMEGLRQAGSTNQGWGIDTAQVHQLMAENSELNAQLAHLSQQLEHGSGVTDLTVTELQEQIRHLERTSTHLSAQLESREAELTQHHHRELRKIESEKENRLLELKNEHETLISLLTEQNERLESELKDASETARTAAAAAVNSPASSPRDLSAEDEKKVMGLKATIMKLVDDNKALSKLNEHNAQLKTEIQHMMKVKSRNEDLLQDNARLQGDNAGLHTNIARLQSEVKKLEQAGKSKGIDADLQGQMQILADEKTALQDHVAQLEESHRQSQAVLHSLPPSPRKESRDPAYPQTWRLVDQLRNQNKLLIIEVNELRASKEVGGSESGSSLNRSTSSSIRQGMRAVLGLKKNKDKHSVQVADRQTIRPATGNAEPQADFESQSTGSFNDGSAAEAERSAQSQVSSQALPDEDLMAVAEERLMQAEQRALRAEEATQAQEGLISQLCEENIKLGDEIQRLNGSMDLLKSLTDENSRLIRDNKRANESLDSMLKDISELENRLFDIALQAPDDGGDIFDDAFADPAEVAERKAARKEAAAKQDALTPRAGEGVSRATGMNKEMKKRQEETAAEVRLRDSNLAKDEERHQQLKQEGEKQLETFERVKEKINSPTTPFSLARQRLQRANSGLGSSAPPSTSNSPPPVAPPAAASHKVTPDTVAPAKAAPAYKAASTAAPTYSKEAVSTSQPAAAKVAFPPPSRPRSQDRRQGAAPEAARGPPLVASPAVSLPSPAKSLPSGRSSPSPAAAATAQTQEPVPRHTPTKPATGPSTLRSPFATYDKPSGDRPNVPTAATGAPPTPERSPTGRLPSGPMLSGRLPSGILNQGAEPAEEARPGHTRSLSRENSLMRTESGKERLRLEAEASRAEIWAKIQAAKMNNSQKQRGPDASSQSAAAVQPSSTPAPTAAAGPKSAPQQVQEAYVQHSGTHDIVGFMQRLGYADFTAAGPEEAKIEQFKRALKLTRATSNINKPPKEKEMASAIYQQLQIWFDQFIYKR